MNKKAAFTMVELIFVIVILGILAAVAVPRLNASREDAKLAKVVSDWRTLLNDIHSYYAAQGSIPKGFDFTKLTNVPLKGEIYHVEEGDYCLHIAADDDDCVVVWHNYRDAKGLCAKAIKKLDEFMRADDRGRTYAGVKHHCDPKKPRTMSTISGGTSFASAYKGIIYHLADGVDFD